MGCSLSLLAAMTAAIAGAFALRGVTRPRAFEKPSPFANRGAENAGCSMHPQPSVLGIVSMHTGIHSGGHRKHPAFPTRWFERLLRSPRGTVLSCPRHPRASLETRELDTSVGVSEPHGLTVRENIVRPRKQALRHLAATAPCLHVHDDRDAPLLVRRDATKMPLIWGVGQRRVPAAR
jgi:hypothetical protein